MRTANLLTSFFILIFCLAPLKAHAYGGGGSQSGFKLMPSAMYLYNNQTGSNGSGTTTSRYLLNASLGYLFSGSPFYAGAIYGYDSTVNTGNSSAKDTFTSYGVTLGVMTENLYMLFSYFLSSTYDQANSSGVTTSYTSGSGFQVAIGYLFSIGSSIHLGPELDYRSLSYTQVKNPNGSTGSASLTNNSLLPYVTLMISL